MYLNKSYYIYIVNGKICSSRLAKQDFLYIDDINWGGGLFQNGQRTVNFVFYTEFLLTIRSMLILSPKSSADASEFE